MYTESNYNKTNYESEYVIVGTGAGGAVVGAQLAEQNKEVLFIEEGGLFDTKDYSKNTSSMMQKLYRNGGAIPILGKPTFAFGEGNCVGGGTVINAGLIWRTPPWILEEWETRYKLRLWFKGT